MKTIDSTVVLATAMSLIDTNGSVTTLEVKNSLRSEGYWAKQPEVSKMLADVAQSAGWTFTDNGVHRTYVNHPTVKATVPASHSTKPGDWIATSTTNAAQLVLPGFFTRDEARRQYKETYGVKWENTRTKRAK